MSKLLCSETADSLCDNRGVPRRYGLVQPAQRRCTVLPPADTVLAEDDEVVLTRPVTLPASECQPLALPVPIDLGVQCQASKLPTYV